MKKWYVKQTDMAEWKAICRVWCRKNHAELLFVNSESFGCEMPDGTLRHIYIDELLNLLQEEN